MGIDDERQREALEERVTIPFPTVLALDNMEELLAYVAKASSMILRYRLELSKELGIDPSDYSPDMWQTIIRGEYVARGTRVNATFGASVKTPGAFNGLRFDPTPNASLGDHDLREVGLWDTFRHHSALYFADAERQLPLPRTR